MLDCEGSLIAVEPTRNLSEMEPSGVSVEVTKSCTNEIERVGLRQEPGSLTHFTWDTSSEK